MTSRSETFAAESSFEAAAASTRFLFSRFFLGHFVVFLDDDYRTFGGDEPLGPSARPTVVDNRQCRPHAAFNDRCRLRRSAGLCTASDDQPDATGCASQRRDARTEGGSGRRASEPSQHATRITSSSLLRYGADQPSFTGHSTINHPTGGAAARLQHSFLFLFHHRLPVG